MREYEESTRKTSKMKQRIVGGVVLALVLAVFLPFIFSHSHLENTATEISTNNNTVNRDQPAAIPDNTSTPISPTEAENSLPRQVQAVPQKQIDNKTVDKKGWVVQVASFNEPLYARQLSMKLNHQGIKVFTQKDPTRPLIRVFIGPFATQAEAQQYQEHLKNKYKLDGIVKENQI